MRNPQLNPRGELAHLLTTEGLSRAILTRILDTTELFLTPIAGEIIKTPLLQGKKVLSLVDDDAVNQASIAMGVFERAAQSLSAEWLGIQKLDRFTSSALADLKVDMVILRAEVSGVSYWMAQQVGTSVHMMNAGDGCHADPTSALLSMHTIRRTKKDFANLTVVLVGDVLHSGLARSCIHALTTLCVAEVRAVAPLTLLPEGLAQLGVRAYTDIAQGLRDADVIIMLDQAGMGVVPGRVPSCVPVYVPSVREYFECYGLTEKKLAAAKPDCLVLWNGEQGLEREVASVAVRMAAMSLVMGAAS
jgi:aspartate carbamoyltransferase catalytic subunit